MTAQILTSPTRRSRWRLGITRIDGWFATVGQAGMRLEVSKMDGESDWTVDALYAKNGMPAWVHGFGNRECRTQTLTPEAGERLDLLLPA